jgi:hypothetical protein
MAGESIECKNCKALFEGNYCNNCGQKADQKRFTFNKLLGEFIYGFVRVHGGFLFTVKELFNRPGEVLRGYIEGKRVNYYRPFSFLVMISLAGSFLYTRSGIIEYINENFLNAGEIINFTREHFRYRLLMAIPTYALTCWVLYRSYHYNLAEHLIINTYLISQSSVIMIVWLIISSIGKPENSVFLILFIFAFLSLIIYQVIVFFHLFNIGNKALRWLKAIAAVIIGFGLSFILINILVRLGNLFLSL